MTEEKEEKIEEQDETLKVIEPEPIKVDTIEHTKSSNIDDDLGNQFTKTQKDSLIGASYGIYAAGDIRVVQESSMNISTSTSYEKVKEVRIDMPGELRIKFDIMPENYGTPNETAYGRIYKNGAAIGTVQSSNDETQWVTKSEDIGGWVAGDYLQLYVKTSNASSDTYVRDLEILCDSYADSMKWAELSTGALTADNTWIADSSKETITGSATYVKMKEIQIIKGGTYRTSFDLASTGGSGTISGRIYKNGAAIGTERSFASSENYVIYTEDLTFAAGDLVQLYAAKGTANAAVRNFKLGVSALSEYAQVLKNEV